MNKPWSIDRGVLLCIALICTHDGGIHVYLFGARLSINGRSTTQGLICVDIQSTKVFLGFAMFRGRDK